MNEERPIDLAAEAEKGREIQDRVKEVSERVRRSRAGGASVSSAVADASSELLDLGGARVFVAPAHPNGRFLVVEGTLIKQPSPNGPWDHSAEGRKFAKFQSGILSTDDPDIIAWCEEHPDICRDALHPETPLWAQLTEQKHPTSRTEATLPSNLDVEAVLRGDLSSLGTSDVMGRAASHIKALQMRQEAGVA